MLARWARKFIAVREGSAGGKPKRIFARQEVLELRKRGLSYRQIARQMQIGEGIVRRLLAALTYMEAQ